MLRRFNEFTLKWRLLALEGAAVFNEVGRLGIHFHEGASSVADLAEERGVTASSAREIQNLGKAILNHEEVRPDVEVGDMPVANAAVVGRLDPDEDWGPEDDWLTWARIEKPRDFFRRFQEHRARVYEGRPVMPYRAFVTYLTYVNLERARKLASRSAGEILTAGRALSLLALEYLDKHDPLHKTGKPRRTPYGPAEALCGVGSRYISKEVVREVLARTWDRCAVPYCSKDIFLTFSHRTPHREGGSCEADNLDRLCAWHHMMYEQGTIVIEGTPDNPVFKTVDGRVVGENGSDWDFNNAKAARDNAEDRKRWDERDARAAARAKEKASAPPAPEPPPPEPPPPEPAPPEVDPAGADPPEIPF